jgi:spore coat polysaccharide biosynthesis protein SpsF
MNILAIVQARMGSTRLPGKVLMDLAGQPMLARVLNRLGRANTLTGVVVATTTEPADNVLADLCHSCCWPCFRGSQTDVLDRYYRAAQQHRADIVVRITADCPLIEPAVVDRVVTEFLARQPMVHYACNFLPGRTFPRGLDTEVFGFNTLEKMWREDENLAWREHVTEYLLHHPELFATHGVLNEQDLSQLRWTVDTPEDMKFARKVYGHFGHDRFSWREVLRLLEDRPDLLEINRDARQKVIP